ncbi:MAG: hypothetical protein Kow0042_11340 [Calditrichia bacterium]
MQINFCKNHQDQVAHFRCYYCKDPLCAECRLTLSHHFFCSRRCYLKFQIEEVKGFVRRKKLRILVLFQAIILIALIWQIYNLNRRIDHLQSMWDNVSPADTLMFPNYREWLQNFKPDYRALQVNKTALQKGNVYSLNFSLKKNWVVNIWKNQRQEISQLISEEGAKTFSFDLNPGKNIIRVLILDENQNPIHRDVISLNYHQPVREFFARSIEQGSEKNPRLALTFDGGSDNAHTEEILAILRDNRIKCTLFLTGKFIEKHPDLVLQMLKDGHEIANHTYSHPHLTTYAQNRKQETLSGVTRNFLIHQLLKTDSVFYQLTGQHLQPFWRAPYGEYNPQILSWAAEAGFLHIRWTPGFDTFDWVTDESSKLFKTPDEIFEHFLQEEKQRPAGLNGIIVLMHLGSHRNNNHVYESLPGLIRYLKDRKYVLAPISELLEQES